MTITGAFAGAGIQYVIPATLVWLARRRLGQLEAEVGVMRMLTVMQYLAGADSVDLHICPGLDDDDQTPL